MQINKNTEMIIVGGGITGLVAAYLAARGGKKVSIIEASNNFGGLLNTFSIAGKQLEHYYHIFCTHDKEFHWLIKELNIQDQVIFKKTSMGVFRNGKIYDFNSLIDLLKFKPIRFFDKIKFIFNTLYLCWFANWKKYENVSCASWFQKWSGKSTCTALWMPMLNIKFGPYASEVPLAWMIGRLRQRVKSRKNTVEYLAYINGSLQILLDALIDKLKDLNVEFINNAPIETIEIKKNKIQYITSSGRKIVGDKYLFTIPGVYLGKLLRKNAPVLSEKLEQIKYFGAVCVVVEMKHALSNCFWLNVADDGFPFGGVIEQTNLIDPEYYNGSHIVYFSRYFSWEEKIADMDDEEIKTHMLSHVHKIYPHFKESSIKNTYVFKTMTAAPVCDLNFSKKIPNCKTDITNLFVANMAHVYPDERASNNSIRIAAEACRVMGMDTSYVPKNCSLSGVVGF